VHELDQFRAEYDSDVCSVSNIEVERLLSKMKLSASGCDDIPAWLLRSCSYELADILAHIINCSISTVKVPSYWLNAVVRPTSVPKVSNPSSFTDFRPISVTPHISRLTEKIIVRHWVLSFIPSNVLLDQYAFKPAGSTTAALTYLMHHVTKMNEYVRCLMIDFSKPFDMVDHVTLVQKLLKLHIPGFVVNLQVGANSVRLTALYPER